MSNRLGTCRKLTCVANTAMQILAPNNRRVSFVLSGPFNSGVTCIAPDDPNLAPLAGFQWVQGHDHAEFNTNNIGDLVQHGWWLNSNTNGDFIVMEAFE